MINLLLKTDLYQCRRNQSGSNFSHSGGCMKKNPIKDALKTIFGLIDSVWSTINQLPPHGKFPKPKETPYFREHSWEKKKRYYPKNTKKDAVHNEWPLGSERTETKIFNKLRKQRHGSN